MGTAIRIVTLFMDQISIAICQIKFDISFIRQQAGYFVRPAVILCVTGVYLLFYDKD